MLIQNEQASEWINTQSLSAERNATWGRQEDFKNNSSAFNAIGTAHKAVEAAIDV